MAEVVEVADVGERLVLRLCRHAAAHLEGRAVGEGRAEHAPRIDSVLKRVENALRKHLGLARTGRSQHQMRSRAEIDDSLLFDSKIHVDSLCVTMRIV